MDVAKFHSSLDDLTSWRKKELWLAHSLAENAPNDEAQRYLCRAWILAMYAHCDGFLKGAAKYYMSFLERNVQSSYRQEIVWLLMHGKDNAMNSKDRTYISLKDISIGSNGIFFEMLKDGDEVYKSCSFDSKTLRFFSDWVLQIDFGWVDFEDICKRLVKARHAIAHGEEAYEDIEACRKWHVQTIEFMDGLKDKLLDAANTVSAFSTTSQQ